MRLPVILFTAIFVIFYAASASASSPSAQTTCYSNEEDPHQMIYFYNHPLGYYDVHLAPTLNAIRGNALKNGNTLPYFAKPWNGPIAGLCPEGGCYEFTVYPNRENFTNDQDPSIDIMQDIMKYFGQVNRGEVRIITDHTLKHYIYTTDHETSFCGPYNL